MSIHKKYLRQAIITLALIVPSFIGMELYAQDVYSLKQCLDIAMEKNFSLQISRNANEIAANNTNLANAGFLPVVSVDGSYTGTVIDKTQESNLGDVTTDNGVHDKRINVGANLSWNLFAGFKVQATYARLKELQAMGELNLQLVMERTIVSITSEYYNYIRQKQRYDNFSYVLSLSRERLRITETQYELGARSKMEVIQAKVDYNTDSSNLVNQQQVVLASIVSLRTEMGDISKVDKELQTESMVIAINPNLDYTTLLEQSLNSNLNLLVAIRNKNISEFDLKLVRSRVMPFLRVNSGYGYTQNQFGSSTTKKTENIGMNYGVTVGINILDGFNHRQNMKNARLGIKNKELAYQELELDIRSALYEVYNSYRNDLQLLDMETQNLATATENFEIALERYRLGTLSGIELREAQRGFQDAEERMLLIKYRTKIDEIHLKQISGQIFDYL